jgi:hypothetical protein
MRSGLAVLARATNGANSPAARARSIVAMLAYLKISEVSEVSEILFSFSRARPLRRI